MTPAPTRRRRTERPLPDRPTADQPAAGGPAAEPCPADQPIADHFTMGQLLTAIFRTTTARVPASPKVAP